MSQNKPRYTSHLLLSILVCLYCVVNAAAQVRLGSLDADKLLLKAAEAKYPKIDYPYPPQGVVVIEATISETGVVTSAKAIEGHPFLENAAVAAVQKYKYKPYTVDGKPASFSTEVYVGFPPLSGKDKEEFDRRRQLTRQYFQVEPECKKILDRDSDLKHTEEACSNLVRIAEQFSPGGSIERMRANEWLGHVLLRQKRYPEALDSFNRAIVPMNSKANENTLLMGRLYGNVAIAHHLMGDLEKAREVYRRAEKIFQTIYATVGNSALSEISDELKTSCAQELRRLLQLHLKAAEESGDTTEVSELQRLLKTYQ